MRFRKSFSVFLVVLLLSSFYFSVVVPVYAAPIFSDGFETNNFNAWTGTTVNPATGALVTETASPHHGTYNMNSTLGAGGLTPWQAYAYYGNLSGAYSTLYMRAYVQWNSNPAVNPNILPFFGVFDGVTLNTDGKAGIGYNGSVHWAIRYRTGGAFVNVFGNSVPTVNTVYCVEFQITRSHTAGIVRLYVDNALEIEVTGLVNDEADRRFNYVYFGWCGSIAAEAAAKKLKGDCFVLSATYIGPEDVTPPTYSGVTTNTTVRGMPCNFNATLADGTALANYTFGTNNTGAWVNDTVVTISGASYTVNTTKTLNSTVGVVVQWKYWFADSNNNLNNTEVLSNTTTLLAGSVVLSQAIHPSYSLAGQWSAKALLSQTVADALNIATQSTFKPSLSQAILVSWSASDKWTAKAALSQTLSTAWSVVAGWTAKVNLAESFTSVFSFVGGWAAHTLGFDGGLSTSWNAGLTQGLKVGFSQTVTTGWGFGAGWASTVGLSQTIGFAWSSLSGWTSSIGLSQSITSDWSVLAELSHMGQYILDFSLPFSSSWNTLTSWTGRIGFTQSLTGNWNLLASWSSNVGFIQSISTDWLPVAQWIGQVQLSEQIASDWTGTVHWVTDSQLSHSLSAGFNNFEQLSAQAIFTSPIATVWSSLSSWSANVGLSESVTAAWSVVVSLFHAGTFVVNFNQPLSVSWSTIIQWTTNVGLFQPISASWMARVLHMSISGSGGDEFIVLGLFGMVVVAVPSLAIGLVIRKRKEK